jgi:hypothetical protein
LADKFVAEYEPEVEDNTVDCRTSIIVHSESKERNPEASERVTSMQYSDSTIIGLCRVKVVLYAVPFAVKFIVEEGLVKVVPLM